MFVFMCLNDGCCFSMCVRVVFVIYYVRLYHVRFWPCLCECVCSCACLCYVCVLLVMCCVMLYGLSFVFVKVCVCLCVCFRPMGLH